MPDQEEVKQTKPQSENPAKPQEQDGKKVEAPKNELTPVEEVVKTIINEATQKLQEKKDRATRQLEQKRKEVEVPEKQQAIQLNIEAIAQDPAKNEVGFLVETGETPKDKDLQVIILDISQKLQENTKLFEGEAAVPVMEQWMLLLKAAEKNKPDDAQAELRKYRERLAKKFKEVALEKGRREDERNLSISNEKKELVESYRTKFADYWEDMLINTDEDSEKIFLAIQKGMRPSKGASGTSGGHGSGGGATPPRGPSVPPPSGSSSGGTPPSGGGGSGSSGGVAWQLYDESSVEFRALPPELKTIAQEVNNMSRGSPGFLTDHYLEGVARDVAKLRGVDATAQDEVAARLDSKRAQERNVEKQSHRAERVVESKERLVQQFENSLRGDRSHEALGYRRQDVFFLEYILGNPQNVEAFIKGENFGQMLKTLPDQTTAAEGTIIEDPTDPDNPFRRIDFDYMDFGTEAGDLTKNYQLFKKYVKRVYDHLFDSAAINRLVVFDKTEDPFVHRPIKNKIYSNLQTLSRYFSEPSRKLQVGEVVKYDYKHSVGGVDYGPNKVHIDPNTSLDDALAQFSSRLNKESDLREYNHNVGYILGTKRSLEDLAGFAQQLDATQFDTIFLEDELLQTAYRFYIQELKKTSADKFWMMGPTWLSEDPQGKISIEEHVKDSLKQLDTSLSDRDLNRIISMASGMAFGITGEGFDILAQNQPPLRDGSHGYRGYYADNILPYWNIQHNFQRWGTPNHMPELLYLKIMKGGQFGKFWDYKELKDAMEHDRKLLKTGLTWSLSGGPPIMDVASRIFGIKGVLGRGGWRMLALTTHHLVPKEENGRALPITKSPYNPNWSSKEGEEWAENELNLKNIDWDKSFVNLEKAGVGVMFSYWIDQRVKAEGHGGHGHGDDPLKEQLYKQYLEKTRGRNPLIFLRYDMAPQHKGSLRYRALNRMAEFAPDRDRYENIKGRVDEIERDLYLIVDSITQNNRWDAEQTDWDKIQDPVRRDRAKSYWKALQTEIGQVEGYGTIAETYDRFFKGDDSKYYFFGSEDINFQELAFREGGFDILKRAYNDINTLSKSVDAFFKYPDVLKAAASGRDYGEIIKAIHEICHPIEGIHGPHAAEEMTYYLVTIASRFFGKNTGSRLPFGIGTLMGFARKSSLSEAIFGKNAWQWDENKTAEFIQAVRSHTGLIPTDSEHWYNMKNLSAEVGARNWQALYDVLRGAIPLILMIIMWQAIQSETKDQH